MVFLSKRNMVNLLLQIKLVVKDVYAWITVIITENIMEIKSIKDVLLRIARICLELVRDIGFIYRKF